MKKRKEKEDQLKGSSSKRKESNFNVRVGKWQRRGGSQLPKMKCLVEMRNNFKEL